MNVKIKNKNINIFLFILLVFLSIIVLLATVLGSYMLARRVGQLKNNSLSTKLEAYSIENDFWNFDKFDDEFDNILFCGVDNFQNTDVIMVISINKKLHNINILRIPRDTYIGEHYNTGKINAVYSSPKESLTGADTLTYEINNIFRIKIDKYIFMTLDIFENMVDDIGGVDIKLKKDVPIDANNIIKAGNVHLNGKLGADFVRHRKSYLTGDIGRINAQEQFVKALGKKLITEKYFNNVGFLNKYYNQIETNIGRKEVGRYTEALKNVNVDDIKTFVFQGVPVMHNKYSVYVLDVKNVVEILNRYFVPSKVKLTEDDIKLVKYLEPDEVNNFNKQNDACSGVLSQESNFNKYNTSMNNTEYYEQYLEDEVPDGGQDFYDDEQELKESYEEDYNYED